MASITTVDGIQFLFDLDALCAIADGDEQTGASGTVIYGLAPKGLRVNESIDAVLQRLGLTSAFAKFTRADGSLVLVNGKSVNVARQPFAGEYAPEVRSVIFTDVLTLGVHEQLDEVRQAVNHAGGKL